MNRTWETMKTGCQHKCVFCRNVPIYLSAANGGQVGGNERLELIARYFPTCRQLMGSESNGLADDMSTR